MSKFNKEDWVGRKFKCKTTGEVVVITENMAIPRELIIVGDGFIDLGDGYYSRWSGIIEIDGDKNE